MGVGALSCFSWPLLPNNLCGGLGCKATFAQLVQPQNKRKPTGCRTKLPLGPSSLCKPSSLQPQQPRTAPRSPFLTAHPDRSLPPPPNPAPQKPIGALRTHQQIPNSPQPFQEKSGGGGKTMTSRAGLFGFVCLLVGSIKYSWKVNVPHTGEV